MSIKNVYLFILVVICDQNEVKRSIKYLFSLSTTGSKSLCFPNCVTIINYQLPSTLSLTLSAAAHNTHNLSSIHHHKRSHDTQKKAREDSIGQESSQAGSGGDGTFHFTLVLQHK